MDTLDLGGRWRLRQADKKRTVAATVPGCVHTDLMAAGVIDDPSWRDNLDKVQWIGETNWVYSRAFSVPAPMLARDRVVLRCEGLDTFATIAINGRRAGKADNMFRSWEFDVKRLSLIHI